MTKKTPHTVRRKPEQDRSKKRVTAILEAAKSLITKQGIEPFSMTHVATEAGMGLTALYRYFPNKAAVIRELSVQMLKQDKQSLMAQVLDFDGSIDELVRFATQHYVELYQQEPYRLSLRKAIQADTALLSLDMQDSSANAEMLAQKVAELAQVQNIAEIKAFVLLYTCLLNATIELMAYVEDSNEAEASLETFITMSLRQLHVIVSND